MDDELLTAVHKDATMWQWRYFLLHDTVEDFLNGEASEQELSDVLDKTRASRDREGRK